MRRRKRARISLQLRFGLRGLSVQQVVLGSFSYSMDSLSRSHAERRDPGYLGNRKKYNQEIPRYCSASCLQIGGNWPGQNSQLLARATREIGVSRNVVFGGIQEAHSGGSRILAGVSGTPALGEISERQEKSRAGPTQFSAQTRGGP